MRLIDADALIGQYNKFALTAQTDYAEGVRDVINDINNAPIIERKRGKWIRRNTKCEYRCSECGKIVFADDENELNFCCSCGADMRGKGDE